MFEEASGPIERLDGLVQFTERPTLVPAAARGPWRLALVCLVISRFRQQSARLDHIHLIHWGISTPKTGALLKVWLDGTRPMDSATTRVDPALEVTLTIALASGFVTVLAGGKVVLTELGKRLVEELDAQDDVLAMEKGFLESIGPLTEAGMTRRLGAISG